MFNFFKRNKQAPKSLIDEKKDTLTALNAESISSIAMIQESVNNLTTINTTIDQTKNEIADHIANFNLIDNELDVRKANNANIIEQIKAAMEAK